MAKKHKGGFKVKGVSAEMKHEYYKKGERKRRGGKKGRK